MDYEILANCTGFEWDTGNLSKNWDKHLVSRWECEQVFFNRPILIHDDKKHSIKERSKIVMSNLKKVPKYKTLEKERKFWQTHDSSDYIDWEQSNSAYFPNLKPSTSTISLRLPENLLYEIKTIANKEDIP